MRNGVIEEESMAEGHNITCITLIYDTRVNALGAL
jgi:hypothetical protein